jgi:hypothetical protein
MDKRFDHRTFRISVRLVLTNRSLTDYFYTFRVKTPARRAKRRAIERSGLGRWTSLGSVSRRRRPPRTCDRGRTHAGTALHAAAARRSARCGVGPGIDFPACMCIYLDTVSTQTYDTCTHHTRLLVTSKAPVSAPQPPAAPHTAAGPAHGYTRSPSPLTLSLSRWCDRCSAA